MLKEQLAQEAKRRQMYISRSSRAGREMQQLRQTLGDSLRHIAQDPVDPELLESETRRYILYNIYRIHLQRLFSIIFFLNTLNLSAHRLDTALSLSLPPTTGQYNIGRSISPRSPY